MHLYKKFQDGVPEYLARHYWWAYLWRYSIRFFDLQPVISAILFGQYGKLLKKTLANVERKTGAKLLQLTCVYGKLTPSLLSSTGCDVHLCDIAIGQLRLARRKTAHAAARCHLTRMNAECLGYRNDTFDQVIVFFLLHEMPAAARHRTYDEIARVVKIGGSVLITEYAAEPRHHPLYRFSPFRRLLCRLEPFLQGFWQEDLTAQLRGALQHHHKELAAEPDAELCFAGLYRVMRFAVVQQS